MDIDSWLPGLRREYDVPGCAVGVLTPDGIVDGADGVLHLGTAAPASTGALFQVGSVTKLVTATLILRAVEQGLLRLDDPVVDVVPQVRLGEPSITVRQLLTHTSGLFGDAFTATSRGDDAVARYVDEVVPTLPQDMPPGSGLSYSNSGFVLLGRIAEVLLGRPFHELVAEHVAAPLDLTGWAAVPEQALLHATALGHVTPPGGAPTPAPVWSLPASTAPAGSLLAMTPRALLTFAHDLVDGHRVLGAESLREAWTPQAAVPDLGSFATNWGLGWMLFDRHVDRAGADTQVVGHDGGTIGQSCLFRLVPERGVAVVSMANGGRATGFHHAVARRVLGETAGVAVPGAATPPADPGPVDAARYAGRYDSSVLSLTVTVREDGTACAVESATTPESRALLPDDRTTELVPLDDGRLIALDDPQGLHEIIAFPGGGPGAPATHVFRGGRLTARSGPA